MSPASIVKPAAFEITHGAVASLCADIANGRSYRSRQRRNRVVADSPASDRPLAEAIGHQDRSTLPSTDSNDLHGAFANAFRTEDSHGALRLASTGSHPDVDIAQSLRIGGIDSSDPTEVGTSVSFPDALSNRPPRHSVIPLISGA